MKDPLAGTGADYVFVAFAASILPRGRQVEIRAQIEDALDAALMSSASGRLLGGATGTLNAYIDLLLFDGAAGIEIIKRIMGEKGLPAGSSINYFSKEKGCATSLCRISIDHDRGAIARQCDFSARPIRSTSSSVSKPKVLRRLVAT